MMTFRQGGTGLQVSIAASNTTTAIPADATGTVVAITNPSTTLTIYARLVGSSATSSAVTDLAIPPSAVVYLDRSPTLDTHIALFGSGAGPTLVNVAIGEARFR